MVRVSVRMQWFESKNEGEDEGEDLGEGGDKFAQKS